MTASAQNETKRRPRGTGRRNGRPTKLTAPLQKEICELIARGVPSEDAAVSVGIARRTFFQWLERGNNGEPLYAEFQLAVDEAFATFHVATVGQATADPRNAMEILEKRFPKKWGRTDRHQVDVNVTQRPLIDTSKGPLERLLLLRELLVEFSADAVDLPHGSAPAGELLAGIIDGEVVSEEDVA